MKLLIKFLLTILVIQLVFFQVSKVEGKSMNRTFYEDDIIFVSLFSYGLAIPTFHGYSILPDFFNNGHLIKGDGPKHGDVITIKHNSKDKKEQYIKRCFAIGGDEIIFTKNKIYLKTKAKLKSAKRNINNEIWYANPYDKMYFSHTFFNDFKVTVDNLIYNNIKDVRKPIYIEGLTDDTFIYKNKKYNAFYYKVPKGKYFVQGDNVNMSSDSRLFGAIPYSDILGKVVGTLRL